MKLITFENISVINLISHIVQATVVTIGNDGFAPQLELVKVVNHVTSEKGAAVFKRGLVDNYLSTLSLDALHSTRPLFRKLMFAADFQRFP